MNALMDFAGSPLAGGMFGCDNFALPVSQACLSYISRDAEGFFCFQCSVFAPGFCSGANDVGSVSASADDPLVGS